MNSTKCNLFHLENNYLRHIISTESVRTEPGKFSAVESNSLSSDVQQLGSFLQLCPCYKNFLKGFSNITKTLHNLTGVYQKFLWIKECDIIFEKLKDALTSSSVLTYL